MHCYPSGALWNLMWQFYNKSGVCYITWPLLFAYTMARRNKLHIAYKFYASIGIKESFYRPIMGFENYVISEIRDKQRCCLHAQKFLSSAAVVSIITKSQIWLALSCKISPPLQWMMCDCCSKCSLTQGWWRRSLRIIPFVFRAPTGMAITAARTSGLVGDAFKSNRCVDPKQRKNHRIDSWDLHHHFNQHRKTDTMVNISSALKHPSISWSRIVVSTVRCGRTNPGSIPGTSIYFFFKVYITRSDYIISD